MAIKLLIGGSPCTHWSIAQKKNRETEPKGEGWELFKNFRIALDKFKPDFFLYENNKSASKAVKEQIAHEFGVGYYDDVRFTYINSALVSAQNRQRFYVTNFGDIEQPEDRGILLKDILEDGTVDRDKSYVLKHQAGNIRDYFKKHHTQVKYEPVRIPDYGIADKSRPVNASYSRKGVGEGSLLYDCFPDNPNKQVFDYVAEPVRVGCLPSPDGTIKNGQGMRIYAVDGKSVGLKSQVGGLGAKTGLYAIPVGYATPIEWDENGIPTKAISGADGKTYTVYEVKDGIITIKGKEYPIKLADGFYIIRKLTVTECCRLQTMPDDYCKAVSDSQAYKGLGNGWTAEVIIHLLNHALKDVPRDEELIVLSMYDGIGTGRYCLDKMGFTNVKYYAYEIDKYPIAIAMDNYPDIIQCGDAFAVREEGWKLP